jgi:hypothetical protein
MAYKYKLIPIAQEEYEYSTSWYLKQSLKVASNFVKAIDQGFANICDDPGRYRNEYKNYYEYTIYNYLYDRRRQANDYYSRCLSSEKATK